MSKYLAPDAVFARFDTVVGCAGMVAGRETPMKLATAALKSGVKRYFPWQFGVDFEVIGRGSPQDLFDAQLDVRELLRAQDKTEWVIMELEQDPTHHIEKYRAVFAQGKGVAWPKAGTFNEQQSIQVTTAEQWAQENLVSR